MTRVLLTVDESPGSLAATRGLRAAGYEPWVATPQDDAYAAHSRAAAGIVRVPDPKADPSAFADAVAAAAERLEVAVVLPCTEGSLRALSGRETAGAVVGAPPPAVVDRALDKTLLDELGRRAGLDVPATVEVRPGEPLPEMTYPAVAKPVASVLADGRTVEPVRVESAAELERLRGSDTWLVQEWVTGTLSAACGVAWNGDVVCLSHQVSPRIWPPRTGISAFATTVPRDERVEAGVRALIRELGWSGVFGTQFLRDGGKAWLIDLNPRIYGSTQLAIAAGHNLPAIYVDLLLGKEPRVGDYRVGVGYRVEEDDVRALARMFRDGRRVEALRGLLPRRNTSHAVFSLRDPGPLRVTARKLLSRGSAARGTG